MKAYGNDIPESYVKYRGFVGTWLQRVEGMRGSRRTRNGEVMVAIGRLRTKDRHPIWGLLAGHSITLIHRVLNTNCG